MDLHLRKGPSFLHQSLFSTNQFLCDVLQLHNDEFSYKPNKMHHAKDYFSEQLRSEQMQLQWKEDFNAEKNSWKS